MTQGIVVIVVVLQPIYGAAMLGESITMVVPDRRKVNLM